MGGGGVKNQMVSGKIATQREGSQNLVAFRRTVTDWRGGGVAKTDFLLARLQLQEVTQTLMDSGQVLTDKEDS